MSFSIATIRSKLYDTIAENDFLQEEEFSDTNITDAMDQAISYWNSSLPLITSLEYADSTEVPAKYVERFNAGTIGILLSDKVHVLSRNRQPVQVEGVATDTNVRMDAYKKIADQYLAQFLQWIGMTKHALAASGIITADPTYDTPVITLTQETTETQDFSIHDYSGSEITLTPYTVDLYVKEYKSAGDCVYTTELSVDGTTASLETDGADFQYGGIYFGELTLTESDTVKYRFPIYINVEPALNSSNSKHVLTVKRMRRVLRDRTGENFITAAQEFTDADLAKAITDCISYWNSAPPRISRYTYTPVTFPDEYIGAWEEAAVGYALRNASAKLLRNMINPAESDTENIAQKANLYQSLGEQKVQQFQKWVQNTKISLNISSAWGGRKLSVFG